MTAQEPMLLFRPAPSASPSAPALQLIGQGALQSIDPDRIILKKIVLTGVPMRVRKRTAVVKHMFYDPLDTKWFKPAELTTAHGLRGHIKESVGTHGLFKALFSAPITQNDTVMLVLYKRVYPKIPDDQEVAALEGRVTELGDNDDDEMDDDDEEEEGDDEEEMQ